MGLLPVQALIFFSWRSFHCPLLSVTSGSALWNIICFSLSCMTKSEVSFADNVSLGGWGAFSEPSLSGKVAVTKGKGKLRKWKIIHRLLTLLPRSDTCLSGSHHFGQSVSHSQAWLQGAKKCNGLMCVNGELKIPAEWHLCWVDFIWLWKSSQSSPKWHLINLEKV